MSGVVEQRFEVARTSRWAALLVLCMPAALAMMGAPEPERADESTRGAATSDSQDPAPSAVRVGVQSLRPVEDESPALAESARPAALRGVHIGQPVEWRVGVNAGQLAQTQAFEARTPELEALGWLVLDGPRAIDPRTRAFTLLPLDAGPLATFDVDLTLVDGEQIQAPAATLEVLSDLQVGEDAPRPPRGLRDVRDTRVVAPRTLLGVLLAAAVLGFGVFMIWRRKRRAPSAVTPPLTPSQRLAAAIPGGKLEAHHDLAAAVGAIGPIVRAAVDHHRVRAGDTTRAQALADEEWCARLTSATGNDATSLSNALAERTRRLVARSAEARFSGVAPSLLTARELFDDARALLEGLATDSRSAAQPMARSDASAASPAPRATEAFVESSASHDAGRQP